MDPTDAPSAGPAADPQAGPSETFAALRPQLCGIAYRLLGSAMDAEDVVQEAYLRWQAAPTAEVESPKAYLTTVVTRLCLDQWRSARTQRETYIGPWLPEPLVTDPQPGPAEAAALADTLSMAFLLLLERLAPVERAVFLLREVFDYDYAEIARIVDRSEANCRQIVRRAREHLAAGRPRFAASAAEQRRLTEQFALAVATGDLPGLMQVLADDITLFADSGGQVRAARNPVYGPDKVGRYLLGVMRRLPPNYTARPALANGQPALIGYLGGRLYHLLVLDIRDGAIRNLYNLLNPEKLERVRLPASGLGA